MPWPRRSTIEGVPFTPSSATWRLAFAEERRRLQAMGLTAPLQHIGSTAVPDLPAKPIIDIQLIGPGRVDLVLLRHTGYYRVRGPRRVPYYERPAGAHTFLIEACSPTDPDVRRCLLFRDYLLTHPDEAAAYGDLKNDLAERYADDPVAYRLGKAPWLEAANARAEEWARTTNWQPAI
ncbi:MAG: GrpB family protein [Acidimicrobiaceae bacterium]|nr:GrpB family protein [Acidimicrobiaceae bacterium]MBO0746799.1 GrpB family protein [Acidimicrobiaceae bacterium]